MFITFVGKICRLFVYSTFMFNVSITNDSVSFEHTKTTTKKIKINKKIKKKTKAEASDVGRYGIK